LEGELFGANHSPPSMKMTSTVNFLIVDGCGGLGVVHGLDGSWLFHQKELAAFKSKYSANKYYGATF